GLLEAMSKAGVDVPFVLITGYASLDSAIEAVNKGAFSYIKKPFNMEEIRIVVRKVRQRQDLVEKVRSLTLELEALRERMKTGGEDVGTPFLLAQPMQPVHSSLDMNKALAAIEYLGRLKNDGLITESEFGEYKGKILKRIV
ncbi:MAG TPA: hypothetical protein PLT69_04765, partial [Deltaproteobacteria bacterium]|nr:hypothetical protein [Deltaproteobacteria bacterium]